MNKFKLWAPIVLVLVASILSTTIVYASEDDTLRLGTTKDEFKLMNLLDAEWYDANFFGITDVGLIAYSSNLSIIPCLAKDWTIAPDGKSIKFDLVKNAKWHDGVPVTAEDVAFTFEYLKKHKLKAEGYWFNDYLDRVETPDNYTINVVFKEPAAATALIYLHVCILPKHIWEKIDDPAKYEDNDSMIGCGPFIFDNYDKDAQVIYLKSNPDYLI